MSENSPPPFNKWNNEDGLGIRVNVKCYPKSLYNHDRIHDELAQSSLSVPRFRLRLNREGDEIDGPRLSTEDIEAREPRWRTDGFGVAS